jgi:hypothetical protein
MYNEKLPGYLEEVKKYNEEIVIYLESLKDTKKIKVK